MTDERDDWFGLHERLATDDLESALRRLGLWDLARWSSDLDRDALSATLSSHLAQALAALLLSMRERDWPAWEASVAKLSEALVATQHPLAGLGDSLPQLPLKLLTEIQRPAQTQAGVRETPRPDVPLAVSALLTGSRHSPSLIGQIEKELASANRADWLVSFIKFSGIRALREALQRFVEVPSTNGQPRLRVATTSYLGATDLKALAALLELPNTEVRVSFDTHRTRLHAKAYLFHRTTGFGTAYVGSANVSRVALDEGLEWTARVSQHELPHLWRQVVAGFEMHWCDPAEFELVTHKDLDRLEAALASERQGPRQADRKAPQFFELKPYGFQQEILEAILAERFAGRSRHLVIAATGTGKTMIAAFDYRRFAQAAERTNRPSLLFVAHREEILQQALETFRHVLRDESFGDLLVGGSSPGQSSHLFCTVQSWHARRLIELTSGHFDYVVLDEAHHASADSYQALLSHLQPKVLLGLTATPERTDGRDIRDDFGGSFTHELRLADAIEARRLAPFHYFGVGDAEGIDFSLLRWQRGGYRQDDLERVVGHNEVRARWVLDRLVDHVAEPDRARVLGFCVSQSHARFMAKFFSAQGFPSVALTADSPRSERRQVQRQLVNRDLRAIFTVDLYNEGVDIPEVDTVLFLRPTESLTVYLQQLGRGLRLHDDKPHLTVLDFIAPQHRNFRYVDRFRALTGHHRRRLDEQVEANFPWLPAGCLLRLDRRAREVVLAHVRASLDQRRPQVISRLREMRRSEEVRPPLQTLLDYLHFDDVDLLLKHGLPCQLWAEAGGPEQGDLHPFGRDLSRGLRFLAVANDCGMLSALRAHLLHELLGSAFENQQLELALSLLWGRERPGDGGAEALMAFTRDQAGLRRDLLDLLEYRLARILPASGIHFPERSGALELHACYSSEQILLALGRGRLEKPSTLAGSGVWHGRERKLDAFFVTIEKSEKDFSPTTRYEDYALNPGLFHWQSQAATSPESPTGQRYIHHAERGYQPLLFVRQHKRLPNGLTELFQFAGPLRYVRHEGSKPMSVVWELEYELPASIYRECRREAV